MIDSGLRRLLSPPLAATGRQLAAARIPATAVTTAGWLAGVGACVATGLRAWPAALALWLVNRLLDGLDGPVARVTAATDAGGFLDIVADFSIYAGVILGLAVAIPAARLACVALLASYYVSGSAFLALSSLAEKRGHPPGDERSLRFVGGLAEGTETFAVYVLLLVLPGHATVITWGFTAAVGVTAIQRVIAGLRLLSGPAVPSAPEGRIAIRPTGPRDG